MISTRYDLKSFAKTLHESIQFSEELKMQTAPFSTHFGSPMIRVTSDSFFNGFKRHPRDVYKHDPGHRRQGEQRIPDSFLYRKTPRLMRPTTGKNSSNSVPLIGLQFTVSLPILYCNTREDVCVMFLRTFALFVYSLDTRESPRPLKTPDSTKEVEEPAHETNFAVESFRGLDEALAEVIEGSPDVLSAADELDAQHAIIFIKAAPGIYDCF